MYRLKQLLILPLICMLLMACTSASSQRCVALPGRVQYCLQPSTSVAAFSQQQKVTWYFKQMQETVLTSVEVDGAGVRMVVLSPMGQTLASVTMPNDGALQVAQLGKNWDATWLLALLQVTRWPATQVQSGLSNNAELHESALLRDIMSNEKVVVDIQFREAEDPYRKFAVHFPALDMRLDIESLE